MNLKLVFLLLSVDQLSHVKNNNEKDSEKRFLYVIILKGIKHIIFTKLLILSNAIFYANFS